MPKSIGLCLFWVMASFILHAQGPQLEWAKAVGGNLENTGKSIAIDHVGNVYSTGYFQGTADMDPGPGIVNLSAVGNQDLYILKLDPLGNFLWVKQIGSTADDFGNAIKVDTAGNCYIAGCFSATADFDPGAGVFSMSPPSVSPDIFVLKLDGAGNFIWAKQIGGSGHDIAMAMTMDGAGNIYTVGTFGGASDFDPGPGTYTLTATIESGFVSKLDGSGNFVWAKQLAATSSCYAKSTGLDTSGNLYVTGMFSGTLDADPGVGNYPLTAIGGADLFVLKLDTIGNLIWAKEFGGPFHDFVQSIAIGPVGNTYTTGYFQDTIDVDPGIGIFNLYNVTGYDIFILKLDSFGNFCWGKSIGGFSENIPNAIALDSACNVYTTGMFQGSSDFDPGIGIHPLMPVANYDQFISKLDSAGNFIWAVALGGTGSENINAIALDSTGNIHTTGWFYGTGDFDPGAVSIHLHLFPFITGIFFSANSVNAKPPQIPLYRKQPVNGMCSTVRCIRLPEAIPKVFRMLLDVIV